MAANQGVGETGGSAYWEQWYADRGVEGVSWYQPEPTTSLELIHLLGVAPETAVIDVGGGAGFLVDHLVREGYTDVTVLDISERALDFARARVGDAHVHWLCQDVVEWEPARQYGLWHDRAALHFLTDEAHRDLYREKVNAAVRPGGGLVLATFAEDGPDSCSGLPVCRYSVEQLTDFVGPAFEVAAHRREIHLTPGGAAQPFNFIAARRTG